MIKIMPSIDIAGGIAVKRIRGIRGTGIKVGDPIKIAETLYENGYRCIHVVDLDAAEGLGDNEVIIKSIADIGFDWLQVGGGIRNLDRASRLVSWGASAIVISSLYFKDRALFAKIVNSIGGDKVIVALDYRSDGHVYIHGWRDKGPRLDAALNDIESFSILGVLFTYIDAEGTMGGIDRNIARYVKAVKGLKEYAGGISSTDDLMFLDSVGIDYAVVGMAFYKGVLGGVPYG